MMDVCNWDHPGADPFGHPGNLAAAIASYEYPEELVRKIKRLESDDVVYISRDRVVALRGNAGELSDMHFGSGRCSGPVQRSAWPADRVEPALVYCHEMRCVAVPTICGNISRIEWAPPAAKPPSLRAWDGKPLDPTPRTIPEPGTWALVALGLAGMAVAGRRRA